MNLLAAAVAAGITLAGTTPASPFFPAPKLIAVTDALKCDWGTVSSADGSVVVINSTPGAVTFQLGSGVKVVGADGRPGAARFQPGQKIRVYYIVDTGANAKEIDLVGADGT